MLLFQDLDLKIVEKDLKVLQEKIANFSAGIKKILKITYRDFNDLAKSLAPICSRVCSKRYDKYAIKSKNKEYLRSLQWIFP